MIGLLYGGVVAVVAQLTLVFVTLVVGSSGAMAASINLKNEITPISIEETISRPTFNGSDVIQEGAFVLPITAEKVREHPLLFDFSNPRFQIERLETERELLTDWSVPAENWTSAVGFPDGGNVGVDGANQTYGQRLQTNPISQSPNTAGDRSSSEYGKALNTELNSILSRTLRNDLAALGVFETFTGIRIRAEEDRGAASIGVGIQAPFSPNALGDFDAASEFHAPDYIRKISNLFGLLVNTPLGLVVLLGVIGLVGFVARPTAQQTTP